MKNEELLHRAPACALVSKPDGLGAAQGGAQIATRRSRPVSSFSILPSAFPFSGVVADKQCTCPASS